jgi:hypothetical protein
VNSIAEVLTHVSVSFELHRALADSLRPSDKVEEMLEEEFIGRHAEMSGASRNYWAAPVSAEGKIIDAQIVRITSIYVIGRQLPSCTLRH